MNALTLRAAALCAALLAAGAAAAQESPPPLGADVEALIAYARTRNPDYASQRFEADAATERILPAGALPDPRLRIEPLDITRMGTQNPALLPGRVGSTRYLLMQELPWFGKRELKRDIAELDARGADGRAQAGWADLAGRIKVAFAQRYYIEHNARLTREILDLMTRLEKIAQVRYAGGLTAQQDVIRAQTEQTALKGELIALDSEAHHQHARLNALLARPGGAALEAPARLRRLPASLDEGKLEDRVRANNPLIFADDARIAAAEKSRQLAYKNRYPDFIVGVAPSQFDSSIKQWDLMLELNLPLQQASRRAQEREAEAMLEAARTRREATANQVLADLSENLSELAAARSSEALAATSQLPQAELTFKAALAGYENGKVDFSTLLDAQRQIRLARQSRLRAQIEAQLRLADIERLLGEDL
jgi:outer membrane protein TolC